MACWDVLNAAGLASDGRWHNVNRLVLASTFEIVKDDITIIWYKEISVHLKWRFSDIFAYIELLYLDMFIMIFLKRMFFSLLLFSSLFILLQASSCHQLLRNLHQQPEKQYLPLKSFNVWFVEICWKKQKLNVSVSFEHFSCQLFSVFLLLFPSVFMMLSVPSKCVPTHILHVCSVKQMSYPWWKTSVNMSDVYWFQCSQWGSLLTCWLLGDLTD